MSPWLETMFLRSRGLFKVVKIGKSGWNHPSNKRGVELDNRWWSLRWRGDNCAIAPSIGQYVSRLPLAVPLNPLRDGEGTALFSWLQWKIVTFKWAPSVTKSHHGSISVSTLCWIIAGFLLDLCYVWVWRWECEVEQKLRVIFVFSFIETVLQLLRACILLPSVLGWLDVGHWVCFIGHCLVNSSQIVSFWWTPLPLAQRQTQSRNWKDMLSSFN